MRYILPLVLLAGCASWDQSAQRWVGQPVDDLVYSWGPPAASQTLEDGRGVFVYSHHRMSDGSSLYCNVTYRTDEAGVVRSYSIDGNIGGCNRLFGSKPI